MKNNSLHWYLLLQYGRTPLDIAEGVEVIEAVKKQQMKVHKTNNDD